MRTRKLSVNCWTAPDRCRGSSCLPFAHCKEANCVLLCDMVAAVIYGWRCLFSQGCQ